MVNFWASAAWRTSSTGVFAVRAWRADGSMEVDRRPDAVWMKRGDVLRFVPPFTRRRRDAPQVRFPGTYVGLTVAQGYLPAVTASLFSAVPLVQSKEQRRKRRADARVGQVDVADLVLAISAPVGATTCSFLHVSAERPLMQPSARAPIPWSEAKGWNRDLSSAVLTMSDLRLHDGALGDDAVSTLPSAVEPNTLLVHAGVDVTPAIALFAAVELQPLRMSPPDARVTAATLAVDIALPAIDDEEEEDGYNGSSVGSMRGHDNRVTSLRVGLDARQHGSETIVSGLLGMLVGGGREFCLRISPRQGLAIHMRTDIP